MAKEDPKLQSVFDRLFQGRSGLKILEVGCGSCSHIDMGEDAYIVGIDMSEKQLARNTVLSEKICGDVEQYQLPEETYDVVICWWVLEHLENPAKALQNCYRSLKKGGALIIAVPNVMSVKGLVTKFTPHTFHIWFYRYIFGVADAGVNDQVPFLTYLDWALAPKSVQKFASDRRLSVEHFYMYENPRQTKLRESNIIINLLWSLMAVVVWLLTFGQVDCYKTDFITVLHKPAIAPQANRDQGNASATVEPIIATSMASANS